MVTKLSLVLAAVFAAPGCAGCTHDQGTPVEKSVVAPKPAAPPPARNQPVPPPTVAQTEPPQSSPVARAEAARLVGRILRGERHEAYESLHPKLRARLSEADFGVSLDTMDATFGKVLVAELKQEFVGVTESTVLGKHDIRRYTYAVTTTQHPKGTHFAVVTIAVDGDRVAPESYQVITFVGEIPPDLR